MAFSWILSTSSTHKAPWVFEDVLWEQRVTRHDRSLRCVLVKILYRFHAVVILPYLCINKKFNLLFIWHWSPMGFSILTDKFEFGSVDFASSSAYVFFQKPIVWTTGFFCIVKLQVAGDGSFALSLSFVIYKSYYSTSSVRHKWHEVTHKLYFIHAVRFKKTTGLHFYICVVLSSTLNKLWIFMSYFGKQYGFNTGSVISRGWIVSYFYRQYGSFHRKFISCAFACIILM